VTAALAVLVWCVLAPVTAGAQDPVTAAEDLSNHDVTFEPGALSSSELDDLDDTVGDLQGGGGYLKVVVLAEQISDHPNARGFAKEVRRRLGGQGRVLVYTPDEVALASNIDNDAEIADAEDAAADQLNRGGSFASATSDGADQLGDDLDTSSSGSSFPWGFVVFLGVLLVGVVGVMWWAARKQRTRATQQRPQPQLSS
jgi:hypothetical protein